MLVGIDGDLQLGADTVIGGNEYRVFETSGLEVEQAAKAANLSVRTGAARGAHEGLDLLDHQVTSIDVDTSLRIGQAVLANRLIGGLIFHGHGLLLKLGAYPRSCLMHFRQKRVTVLLKKNAINRECARNGTRRRCLQGHKARKEPNSAGFCLKS